MKRTSVKLKLKRQLELVRTTVRELTPREIDTVKGGYTEVGLATVAGCSLCCDGSTYVQTP